MREAFLGDSSANRRRLFWRVLAGVAIAAFLAVQAGVTLAQQSPSSSISQGLQNLTSDQMRQMFGGDGLSSAAQGQDSGGLQSQNTILEPLGMANPYLPLSRLEQIMSARAGVKLTQFGYEQLGIGRPVMLPQVGGLQDDYILGSGDQIVVTLRGQDNSEHRVMVDRDGNVVLPRISPIAAAGLRFGDFRAQLLAAVHSAYLATDAYVSIGRLRQISVMVAGEVGSPGVRTLTGLSSPIDAILVSGGIKKTGSLRNVKLIHAGRTISIDLYGFLTTGATPRRVTLGDGDRIVVPPLTKVVAAAGWLRRPGIYEIADGQSALSVRALTNLAGGLEVRGRYRLEVMHIQSDGQTQLVPVKGDSGLVRDGEILMALPGADQVVDRATLAGGTSLSGGYSIKDGTRLSEILKEPGALGTSPYTVFGVISRRDPRTYLRTLVAFSPVAALSGDFDPALMSGDVVRVFSMRESRLLSRSLKIYAAQKRYEDERKRNPFLGSSSRPPTSSASLSQSPNSLGPDGLPIATPGVGTGQSNNGALGMQSTNGLGPQGATNATGGLAGMNGGDASNAPLDEAAEFEQFEQADRSNQIGQSGFCSKNNQMGTPGQYDGTMQTGLPSNGVVNMNAGPSAFGQTAGAQQFVPGATNQIPYNAQNPDYRMQAAPQPPPLGPNLEQQIQMPGVTPLNTEICTMKQLANQLDVDVIVLLNFLSDHEVTIDGAVRGPGGYVVGPGVNLHDLVMVAGGTARWADASGVELTSTEVNPAIGSATTIRKNLALNATTLASYEVKPHDELRFHEVFSEAGLGTVTLQGEVRFPGEFRIIRGEHLLDLLKRAGGLTDVAYPYGAIYLRKSVAALEEEQFRRSADQLENSLLAAVAHTNATTRTDSNLFTNAQTLVQTLRTQKGLGRISVVADPAILAAKPSENPLLEPGDVIFIPQHPSTVSVLGEVLQPGSFTYSKKLSAGDYLSKAGGFSGFADDSLTYVILPDGSAKRYETSWLPSGGESLPPGSVIVVPRDIAPFSWQDFLLNGSQIFSQLAIAGASLAVLSTNLK